MTKEEALPQVGTGHYVMLCGLCLAIIFLVQLQAGLMLTNLLAVLIGALALLAKWRAGPMLLVIFVAIAQLSLQIGPSRDQNIGYKPLELTDVLLCAALLGYVAGHYRLQAIWHQLLPPDVRERAGSPRRFFPWLKRQPPLMEEKRAASQITPHEIAWLVVTLPVWAAVAQLARALLPRESAILPMRGSFLQVIVLFWALAIGCWVVFMVLDFWKHRRHEPATAQLYLQDLLWRDTRGEQRRVNRWLAWWKLSRKKEDKQN
jgi:hypothetical protein